LHRAKGLLQQALKTHGVHRRPRIRKRTADRSSLNLSGRAQLPRRGRTADGGK
jgi:hypothetical protein